MPIEWKPSKSTTKYGVAVYNFHASTILYGLSLRIGETVHILEEAEDWFKGRSYKEPHKQGIFPKNCIVTKEAHISRNGQYEVIEPIREAVVEEITVVLREWGTILKDLFLERQYAMFSFLKEIMLMLMEWRREIIFGKLTTEQQEDLRENITQKIDLVNSKLKLDLVPRVDGDIVDADSASVVELYKIHLASSEKTLGADAKTKNTLQLQKHKFRTLTKHPTIKRAADSRKNATLHHLFISFKTFMCNIGNSSILLFALYDAKTSSYISEKFTVKLTKHGAPSNIEMFLKQFGIFTDLTSSDLLKEVYLVCKIYRYGKLKEDSKKPSNAEYRRPFGAGVADVSSILSEDVDFEKELCIQLFNCHENDYHSIEELLIKKQTGKYNSFGSNNYNVCVDLKVYHSDLEKVIQEKGQCALTPRLGFPEVILPGYVRNDFYVTICKADFDKGSKSSAKNIEVALCAVSDRGQVFNDCMFIGSGDKPVSEYKSFVLYHSNSPQWQETIKISLPTDKFHTAHLRFTFSHCSRNQGKVKGERTFGFSFIKLLKDDGTVIHDSSYSMYIYKLDSSVNFTSVNSYLRLPCNQIEKSKQEATGVVFAGPLYNPKESFAIKTFLCSTKLTQNSDIVSLLRWRRMDKKEIIQALESLLKVVPEEVIKFLQDIFDALFNILSENQEEYFLPVFKALVSITKLVEEKTYVLFKSTLSSYMDEHFSSTLAYRPLISSFCYVAENPFRGDVKGTLKDSAKSIVFLIKMIVKSYQLSNSNVNPDANSEFKEMLKNLFKSLNKMMESTNEYLCECKMELLKRLPLLCDDIFFVFNEQEFSACLQDLINVIPKVSNTKIQVIKMQCLQKFIDTRLFIHPDGRKVLLPVLVTNLSFLLEKKQSLMTCLDVLGELITGLQHLPINDVREDINILSASMLSVILNVRLTIDRKGPMNGLSVSCLLGTLKLMEEHHYQSFLESFVNKIELRDFMIKLTMAFKELLTLEIYPKDWFTLKTVGNNIILTAVQYFSKAFTDYFLQNEYFDGQLWDNYFKLAVLFLIQSALALELFSPSKREKILERYGDMRQIMGFEIIEMWGVLGDHKKSFIPGLIGPFLEMMLIPEHELRKATIPIFYDMMKVEYAEKHTFLEFESELIMQLEVLMNKNKGDLEFQQLFQQIMTDKFATCPDPQLHEEGLKSVQSITDLLKRLLDYRAATSDGSNYQQKMICLDRLLDFYSNLTRKDMYINCVYKLVELHVICNNFSEAGFTLLLYADLLKWGDNEIEKMLKYPLQLEWQRKENLYLEIIEFFDKGKTWERGIELCKELAQQYEDKLLDYTKLSDILRKQAYFYDNIMREMRPTITYFRVSFYGRGFPHYLKDQVFIYRGLELDTLAGFTSRVKSQFPSAEIMFKNTPPETSIVQGIGQHIQICNVNPVPGEITLMSRKSVDEKITSYYESNEVQQFVYSRPFHKGEKDPSNEFKTLWLERTMHWSKRKMPNVLKWSPVESTRKIELTPIENAIESIVTKNRELANIIDEYRSNTPSNVNRLSMVLNGVIDANVNGGIANYQNAFLSEEYLFLNPDDKDNVNYLKTILNEQCSVLNDGLKIHERIAGESLQPFHEKMMMMFSAMKVSIETGQPMESVLNRPTSIQLNGSTNSLSAGKSSPKHPSPKDSPALEGRKAYLLATGGKAISEGDITVNTKKEKSSAKSNLSTSLQNMFRRSSLTPQMTAEINIDGAHSSHKKNGDKSALSPSGGVRIPPPLPPRRVSTPSIGSTHNEEPSSPVTVLPPSVPVAALKRLGLQSSLAASAPSLAVVEEETPSLPPKRIPFNKRHTVHGKYFQGDRLDVFGSSSPSSDTNLPLQPTEFLKPVTTLTSKSLPDITSDNVFNHDFSEPQAAKLDSDMDLYDNIMKELKQHNDDDFYDSPKELVPTLYTPDKTPPTPSPRQLSKSTEDLLEKPTPPSRKPKLNNPDGEISFPPPLPRKSVRKKSESDVID